MSYRVYNIRVWILCKWYKNYKIFLYLYIKLAKYNCKRWVSVSYFVQNILQEYGYSSTIECIFRDCLLEVCRFYHSWVRVPMCPKTMVLSDNGDIPTVFYSVRWWTRYCYIGYWGL